ncbi:uracil-DNA glycosylase [Brevundimonas balnearis]|uniref:Type-4 uracil-DNA glycosylase n=1 Tax=Brevundimonas balnearis TaxID=1572858 RepID=A0ABV6R027_9CAUL
MNAPADISPQEAQALEAFLAFWADAGVEAAYDDAPIDRTIQIAPPPPAPVTARPTPVATLAAAGVPDADEAAAEARRLAAACDDLEALKAAIAGFEGCPLKLMGARQAVFARGRPDAPLLLIGEGPGAEEDAQGLPFVGRAGRLLDLMLEAAGLKDQVLITNTVFWRPPGNRTPSPDEQRVCAPFVERTFALVRPRAVLLLGAAAARSVLKTDDGVMKLRGRWRDWRLPEGGPDGMIEAPVMTTLHPAFLLRQPQAKAAAWADVLEVAAKLDEG